MKKEQTLPRLQNSRFRTFSEGAILACEVREPRTPVGRVRRENDCRLFIQRIRSKRESYNVSEVTEITSQLHLHLTTVINHTRPSAQKRVGVSLQTVCKIYLKK